MRFKFVTLNVQHGGKLMDNIIEFIKEEKPDILFLQEAQESNDLTDTRRFNTNQELQKQLLFPYYLFAPHYEVVVKGIRVLHGNAILSNYPLRMLGQIYFDSFFERVDHSAMDEAGDYSKLPHSMLSAEASIANYKINLFNVHGVWDKHGKDTNRRLKMSNTIVEQVRNKPNSILAGDFNLNPDTQAVRNIEKYLTSVFGFSLESTFNMKHKTDVGFATAVVDQIFVSETFNVLSKRCPAVDISDHLPLICELEL